MTLEDLRFPIGRFEKPGPLKAAERARCVAEIEAAPRQLREAVKGLDDGQLDTPYREEGWTVRQVVHHLPDSHMNSYMRLKLALTEDNPTIRTYHEGAWAELRDANGPIQYSLDLLEHLHRRWVVLWKALNDDQWERTFLHPDLGEMRVDEHAAFYAWHGKHHIAHIMELRKRKGW